MPLASKGVQMEGGTKEALFRNRRVAIFALDPLWTLSWLRGSSREARYEGGYLKRGRSQTA